MKATTMTVRVMAHFRAGEIGGASGAGGVMRGSRRCDRICAGSRQREGHEGAPLRTGAEYREALHDGRRVWVIGEGLIDDVTLHPATRPMVEEYVAWYDRHQD